MVDSIFNMIGDSIYFASQSLMHIVPMDLIVIIMYVFVIYTVTRLLLIPFIGQASSDVVRSARSTDKNNNTRRGRSLSKKDR